MTERAQPAPVRRFNGKPFAIGLGTFLIVGTALTTYFAWKSEVAHQRAADAVEAADRAAAQSAASP